MSFKAISEKKNRENFQLYSYLNLKKSVSFSSAIIFVIKMSAFYACCRYLNALETTFIIETTTIYSGQTAPKEPSDLGT